MNTFLCTLVLWNVICTAQSRIYMSVREGSSVVLPCDWRNKSSTQTTNQSPYIEWRTFTETVFKRLGEEQYQGEGYEGRVDVPEDKLKTGNCSLVLNNVKSTDTGVYESYLLVKRKKRSLQSKRVFIQSVELSVDESSKKYSEYVPGPLQGMNLRQAVSSNTGSITVPSQIITFIILTNIPLYII